MIEALIVYRLKCDTALPDTVQVCSAGNKWRKMSNEGG